MVISKDSALTFKISFSFEPEYYWIPACASGFPTDRQVRLLGRNAHIDYHSVLLTCVVSHLVSVYRFLSFSNPTTTLYVILDSTVLPLWQCGCQPCAFSPTLIPTELQILARRFCLLEFRRWTMRSGLDKPGAIPFLALIVFSLLSLVPSLSSLLSGWELYGWKMGYMGCYRSEVRGMFRWLMFFWLGY